MTFLLDVDNTLLANDEVKKDLDRELQIILGNNLDRRFWEMYEQVRREQGVVDIPRALQRLRAEVSEEQMDDETYRHVHALFDTYPFFQRLYPHVIETLHYLSTLGLTVIVSDGDQYFQAEKIESSHLAEAVEGRVLIYTHKQQHLDEILRRYPAEQYAMVDDKSRILANSKSILHDKLTTVFVRQGKYALEPLPTGFMPDISVEHIGDLQQFTLEQFLRV